MSKVTKTEKILRKASSKWEKFLAEGAFKKTLNESMDFRKAHFAARMEPEELELLNIPEEEYTTKSKEEVEAIAAALKKAHKQSQLGVILDYPKTATYDENEPILMLINKKQKATRAITGEKGYVHYSDEESKEYADSYSNDMPSDHHEQKEPTVNEMTMGGGLSVRVRGEVYTANIESLSDVNIEGPGVNEYGSLSRSGELEDFLDVPDDVLDALEAEIKMNSHKVRLTTEDSLSEMTMGERGMVDAQDGNPPSKIGHGNEEYMAAFNAVMKKMGKEPLPIVKPDQRYLDALSRGNLEEVNAGDDLAAVSNAVAMLGQLKKDVDKGFASTITAAMLELNKIQNYLEKEGGQLEENEKKSFQVGEFVYVVNGSLKGASGKILEPITTSTGEEGFVIELYSDAKMKVFGQRGDEVIALPQDLESGGTNDDMELYDIDERSAEDNLTREGIPSSSRMRTTMSSDPELDQIEDIARDMLEAGVQNSRIPVSLVSVASALNAQGFDANVSGDVLDVDGKYFMGKKENFDISPNEDVRQIMGYVLGFMG